MVPSVQRRGRPAEAFHISGRRSNAFIIGSVDEKSSTNPEMGHRCVQQHVEGFPPDGKPDERIVKGTIFNPGRGSPASQRTPMPLEGLHAKSFERLSHNPVVIVDY
jgi:hypothetical protein